MNLKKKLFESQTIHGLALLLLIREKRDNTRGIEVYDQIRGVLFIHSFIHRILSYTFERVVLQT